MDKKTSSALSTVAALLGLVAFMFMSAYAVAYVSDQGIRCVHHQDTTSSACIGVEE